MNQGKENQDHNYEEQEDYKIHIKLFNRDKQVIEYAFQSIKCTRFIVSRTPMNAYCIIEIMPVWNDGSQHEDFITPEALQKIAEYHRDIDFHDPSFHPSWSAEYIDFYEEYLVEYKVYRTIEDAKQAIKNDYRSVEEDIPIPDKDNV